MAPAPEPPCNGLVERQRGALDRAQREQATREQPEATERECEPNGHESGARVREVEGHRGEASQRGDAFVERIDGRCRRGRRSLGRPSGVPRRFHPTYRLGQRAPRVARGVCGCERGARRSAMLDSAKRTGDARGRQRDAGAKCDPPEHVARRCARARKPHDRKDDRRETGGLQNTHPERARDRARDRINQVDAVHPFPPSVFCCSSARMRSTSRSSKRSVSSSLSIRARGELSKKRETTYSMTLERASSRPTLGE